MYEAGNIIAGITNGLQPTRNAQSIEESSNGFKEVRTDIGVWNARDFRIVDGCFAEDSEGFTMAVGGRGGDELED